MGMLSAFSAPTPPLSCALTITTMVTLATRNAARFAVVTITATSRSAHVRAKAQEALGGTGYSALVRAGWEVERWAQLLVRVRVKEWVRRSVSGVVGVGRIGVRR